MVSLMRVYTVDYLLATSSRCHGLHLCQTGDDRGVTNDRDNEGPEEASESTVNKAQSEGNEDEFPGCHIDGDLGLLSERIVGCVEMHPQSLGLR